MLVATTLASATVQGLSCKQPPEPARCNTHLLRIQRPSNRPLRLLVALRVYAIEHQPGINCLHALHASLSSVALTRL
jgi:hypothetical protein